MPGMIGLSSARMIKRTTNHKPKPMPPPNSSSTPPAGCDCGPLKPRAGEKPIKDGTTADQILAKVQLACDNETGVFFFRHNQKLYLRLVKCPETINAG